MQWIMQERVDLAHPQGLHRWPEQLMVPGDAQAHRWVVAVSRDGTPVDLTGWDVKAYLTRADNVCVPVDGAADGDAAGVCFVDACYAISGELSGTLQASKGDVRITLARGIWQVGRQQGDKVVDPGELLPTLPELLAQISAMQMATSEAEAAVDAVNAMLAAQVLAPAIIQEAAGSAVTVGDAADRPVQSLVSAITAAQVGEGRSSVILTRTGRNLVSHLDLKTTAYGFKEYTVTEDAIDLTKAATYDYASIPVHLAGGVTYTLYITYEVYGRAEDATGSTKLRLKFSNGPASVTDVNIKANGVYDRLIVYTPEEDIDDSILVYPNYGSPVPGCFRAQVMLLEGAYTADTVPAFEPCVRQTLTATLPENVHGGTLDWTNGVLTVTHGADGAELDAPRTVQLDPQQLDMLKGYNAVWSDCGDTTLTYIADTKLYIDNAIAALAANIINA